MNTRRLLYAIPLIAAGILISDLAVSKLTSFTSVNRAWDVTGPGVTSRRDCSSCHSGLTNKEQDSVKIVFSMDNGLKAYVPGTQHVIKFKIFSNSTVGFSSTVLRNDSNKMAGTVVPVDTNETKVFVHTASGRSYVNHKVGTTAGGMKEYSFKWTAPAKGTGPVTFYFSSISSDGNDDTGNDSVYNNSYVITENPGIPSGLTEAAKNADFKVFPNPASGNIHLSFNNAVSGNAQINIFSIDGKKSATLLNESLTMGAQDLTFELPADLTPGIYFVKVSINEMEMVQKVLIY